MRLARTLVAVAVLAALAGCSGDPDEERDRAEPSESSIGSGAPLTPPVPPSLPPSPSPSSGAPAPPGTIPGGGAIPACVPGRYVIAHASSTRTVATAAGPVRVVGSGALPVDLRPDGRWQVADRGAVPVSLDASGVPVVARLNGTIAGTYARSGATYRFTQTGATGSLTGTARGVTVTVGAGAIGPGLVPGGQVRLGCNPTGVTLAADGATLVLRRVS